VTDGNGNAAAQVARTVVVARSTSECSTTGLNWAWMKGSSTI